MSQANQPVRERAVLSFSVEGLTAREELLFKSYVRLLDHRSVHGWLYSAQPMHLRADFKVDLRVVTDGLDITLIPQAQQLLTLGTIDRKRDAYLCLPLRANELEEAMNRQGALILSSRAALTPPGSTEPTGTSAHVYINLNETVRLLRWPPASLLGSPGRMRLATLMTGQPLTLAALQQRSGQPTQSCVEFVSDLKQAGCLGSLPSTAPAQRPIAKPGAAPVVQPGLLARIRSRLGLQTGGRA